MNKLCLLILYPENLLNLFISSFSFHGAFSVFYIWYEFICKKVTVYVFLSNLDDFIYFPCLITMVKTSNTVLNKNEDIQHSFLVPDLRQKAVTIFILIQNYIFIPI